MNEQRAQITIYSSFRWHSTIYATVYYQSYLFSFIELYLQTAIQLNQSVDFSCLAHRPHAYYFFQIACKLFLPPIFSFVKRQTNYRSRSASRTFSSYTYDSISLGTVQSTV